MSEAERNDPGFTPVEKPSKLTMRPILMGEIGRNIGAPLGCRFCTPSPTIRAQLLFSGCVHPLAALQMVFGRKRQRFPL